jgi:serine/threonine protein kinase
VLRGAQIFVPRPCPECGAVWRAREEIGGYRLGEVLGRSGLGIIFRATDAGGGSLAVKLLQAPLAAESADVEYFASEVWALARLDHPHCLRIFATGVDHETAWVAMEWLSHGSLADRLVERGRLREAEVLAIGAQAASALGAAHAAGHPHHDVEPNNILFADARTVKVSDFAQAALYQIAADDLGIMWGRAWYVAPERLRNEPEEAHSDIYALGTVLFHALTGTPVLDGQPHGQITLDLIEGYDVCVDGMVEGLHDKTVQVLNHMLTSEPAQRYQHWGEVATDLGHAGTLVARRDALLPPRAAGPAKAVASAAAPPKRKRRRSLTWLMAIVLLLLFVLGDYLAWKYRASWLPAPRPPQTKEQQRP